MRLVDVGLLDTLLLPWLDDGGFLWLCSLSSVNRALKRRFRNSFYERYCAVTVSSWLMPLLQRRALNGDRFYTLKTSLDGRFEVLIDIYVMAMDENPTNYTRISTSDRHGAFNCIDHEESIRDSPERSLLNNASLYEGPMQCEMSFEIGFQQFAPDSSVGSIFELGSPSGFSTSFNSRKWQRNDSEYNDQPGHGAPLVPIGDSDIDNWYTNMNSYFKMPYSFEDVAHIERGVRNDYAALEELQNRISKRFGKERHSFQQLEFIPVIIYDQSTGLVEFSGTGQQRNYQIISTLSIYIQEIAKFTTDAAVAVAP